MTAKEIKQFWREYCARRTLGDEVIARGEMKIDEDPEYWADHTMEELLAVISEGMHRSHQGPAD